MIDQSITLENNFIQVVVLPRLGAKIISLRNKRSGREWLWRAGNDMQIPDITLDTPFENGLMCGIDECIPTIAPCHWQGHDLPDHGEAWSQAWTVLPEESGAQTLALQLQLPISPLVIKRSLTLEAATLRFAYWLANVSDRPVQYLWALHPLLAIKDGDRIELPKSCKQAQVEVAIGCKLGSRGDRVDWPFAAGNIDLAKMNLGGGDSAVKLYTPPLSQGFAAIENDRTGEFLRFTFDPNEINTLGLWINRGGWNGFEHVALEPTNGAPDRLDIAVQDWKRFGMLAPRSTKRWGVQITIGDGL